MTTLRVEVSALIANAEKVHARLVREHERKVAAVVPALTKKEAQRRLVAALREAAAGVASGKIKPKIDTYYSSKSEGYRNHIRCTVSVDTYGEEVQKDRELETVEEDLKLLRSTTQETVGVQVGSNLAKYL